MAIASAQHPVGARTHLSAASAPIMSAMLVIAGAAAVIAGSYMTWATFYAGLIARNGVPGHGKYFIALAVASVLAAGVAHVRGMSLLRLLPAGAGIAIAVVAARDLLNIRALTDDAAAAFYAPGAGDGLYVVIAGALLLVASALVAPRFAMPARGEFAALAIAAGLIAGVAALVAGGYGEYYLHLGGGGHQHGHTAPSNPAHLLTGGGVALLLAAGSAGMYLLGRRR